MPLPNHVTRLLSEILSETPDRALSRSGEIEANVEKLKALGFDAHKLMNCRWSDPDAVTFAVDAKYHVVMWLANSEEDRAFQHMDFDDYFTGPLRDAAKVSKGVVGMDWKRYKPLASWHRDFFSSGERTNSKLMMGRLWRKEKFVSFWNQKVDVMKEWRIVVDFVTNMGLDPRRCIYEFIDQMEVEPYDEVIGKEPDSTKDVDPEILRQMHTSPELKKAILGTDSGKKQSAMDQFSARQSDGHIKMGDLLKEDPDDVFDKKLGGQVASFSEDDARTFVFQPRGNLLFVAKTGKRSQENHMFHSNMLILLSDIGKVFSLNPEVKTVDDYNTYSENYDLGVVWDESGAVIRSGYGKSSVVIQTFGDSHKMISYFKSILSEIGEMDDDESGTYRTNFKIGISGRYWENTEIVSFWLSKKSIGKLLKAHVLDTFFEYLGYYEENVRLNGISSRDGVFTAREAIEAVDGSSTSTSGEDREALKKAHLDPEAKKALYKGVEMPDKYKGELPVKAHHYARQSDGHIKLGDLLKESPDTVLSPDGKGVMPLNWRQEQAAAYYAFPTCCAIISSGTHGNIWNALVACHEEGSLEPIQSGKNADWYRVEFDDEQELLSIIQSGGWLGNIIEKHLSDKHNDLYSDYRFGYRAEIPNTLAGRVWKANKVISFWNSQHDVLANWKNVEKMFETYFDSLKDYTIDWIERDADYEEGKSPRPMTPASDVSRGTKQSDLSSEPSVDSDGQLNFLSAMFREPEKLTKADDDLLKKIREKMHVLDPQAKAQVMKAVGNLTTHKAAQIADKLGMSVAEFNHIMHVNEEVIQLKNLI